MVRIVASGAAGGDTGHMASDPLEQIELKIAFLERSNTELSDVVYRQQQEIEALRAHLTALAARLDAGQPDQTQYTPEDERPPHY
jgi:SlyX protein